jgi:hypothetical protein
MQISKGIYIVLLLRMVSYPPNRQLKALSSLQCSTAQSAPGASHHVIRLGTTAILRHKHDMTALQLHPPQFLPLLFPHY